MKQRWLRLVIAMIIGLSAKFAIAEQPPRHALDVMQIFLQDPSDANAVFDGAFTSNMRVPPEHLRVKFYDTRTGGELSRQEVREEMGAVRQDGAYEVIRMAMSLMPATQKLSEAVLQDLIDAAFIASMRNPPKHFSIEFYDQRTGPSGIGGGVSGRTPTEIYQAPDQAETSVAQAGPEVDSYEWIKTRYQQLEMPLNHQPGLVALPVYGYGITKSVSEQMRQEQITELSEMLGLEFVKIEDEQTVIEDGRVFSFSVIHFKGDADTIEKIKAELW